MTVLIALVTTLALSGLAPLLATTVALFATDPRRRTDARHVLRLLTRTPPASPPPTPIDPPAP